MCQNFVRDAYAAAANVLLRMLQEQRLYWKFSDVGSTSAWDPQLTTLIRVVLMLTEEIYTAEDLSHRTRAAISAPLAQHRRWRREAASGAWRLLSLWRGPCPPPPCHPTTPSAQRSGLHQSSSPAAALQLARMRRMLHEPAHPHAARSRSGQQMMRHPRTHRTVQQHDDGNMHAVDALANRVYATATSQLCEGCVNPCHGIHMQKSILALVPGHLRRT